MTDTVSKTLFKAKALELFRQVERTGKPLVITDRGVPVLTLAPFRAAPDATVTLLRESVVKYNAATEPVGGDDWEAAR
jgi:antitoxin (DNA-binding transcriptional repressor) of toxin-antitoxin stability system